MKIFILSLFVAAAFAAPAPLDEETGEPVELIVNGVAEGEALEIADVLGIKVKEHVEGQIVSSSDLLYPLSAAGLLEAANAGASEPTEVIVIDTPGIEAESVQVVENPEIAEYEPQPVDLAPPVIPGVIQPPPINIPAIIPEIIDTPAIQLPELVPELPQPVLPEIEDPIESFPEPAPQIPTGEIFNDGTVQVTLNAPESGVLSTVQSWFSMVLNYFNGNVQTTHQIV